MQVLFVVNLVLTRVYPSIQAVKFSNKLQRNVSRVILYRLPNKRNLHSPTC
jgi:hypothetical protein